MGEETSQVNLVSNSQAIAAKSKPAAKSHVCRNGGGGRNGEAARIALQIQHLAKKWRLE